MQGTMHPEAAPQVPSVVQQQLLGPGLIPPSAQQLPALQPQVQSQGGHMTNGEPKLPGGLPPPGPHPGFSWPAYPYPPPTMWAAYPPAPVSGQPACVQGMRNEREDASGRWVLEPEDVLLLERVFALEKCPGRELRAQLAQRLHVKPRQIQVWFQNKRQRTKNGAKPTVAEALAHAVATKTTPNGDTAGSAELLIGMAQSDYATAPGAADSGAAGKSKTGDGAADCRIVPHGSPTEEAKASDEEGEDGAADGEGGSAGGPGLLPSLLSARTAAANAAAVVEAAATAASADAAMLRESGFGSQEAARRAMEFRDAPEIDRRATNAWPPNGMLGGPTTPDAAAAFMAAVAASAGITTGGHATPDGYTNGTKLWIRSDVLVEHPSELGATLYPVYITAAAQAMTKTPACAVDDDDVYDDVHAAEQDMEDDTEIDSRGGSKPQL
mmetsp:Transcript_28004/g.71549  ORF Transcript_28004/g.71549 Transcript_28004/m.71549 type:complete len:440 (-) Transcript_28004:667-1986(-)